MKSRYLLYGLSFFVIFIIVLTSNVRGNPVAVPNINMENRAIVILVYIVLIASTIFIELLTYSVVYHKKIADLFYFSKALIVVNLLTFPVTQITAIILSFYSIHILGLYTLTELIPISIEFLLLYKLFERMTFRECIRESISKRSVFFTTTAANLISFTFGTFILLPIIISIING